jgi:uncharacterized GH25 family protein
MHRKLAVALAAWLLPLGSVQAHFVWVVVKPVDGDDNRSQCCVYFGEEAAPGEAHLIRKIAQTKAWVRDAAGDATELKLAVSSDEAAPALVGSCAKHPAASFEAVCDYGVYERGPGMLLHYYAKHLSGDWQQAAKLARTERLALDIVPTLADNLLRLQVLYKGNPVANAEVVVIDPAGEQQLLKTNEQGQAATPAAGGRFAVRAARVEPDRGGQLDGKKYSQTGHYCTLTLDAPSNSTTPVEPSAAKALERARAGRAVWQKFPGFTADLTVYGESGDVSGKMAIDGEGNVSLDMPKSPLADWVQQQLDTLVQHRMPDGEVSEGDVKYADGDRSHPLGRKLDLGDGDTQSVYRIKDDVITEVNRSAGPMRFTISVLETIRNAENKYLPRSFTMSFFDAQSGQLKSSLGYWNEWQRIGAFDLPQTILENNAKNGGTTTRQIVFRNCRLAEPKTARTSARAN